MKPKCQPVFRIAPYVRIRYEPDLNNVTYIFNPRTGIIRTVNWHGKQVLDILEAGGMAQVLRADCLESVKARVIRFLSTLVSEGFVLTEGEVHDGLAGHC